MGTATVLKHNLFSYCSNSPVIKKDPAGYDSGSDFSLYEEHSFIDIETFSLGGYWVSIPNEAAWSSAYSSPLYSGMYISGFSSSAYTVSLECTYSENSTSNHEKRLPITTSESLRIQNAANRTKQIIVLVGSRAAGNATFLSDWDYILSGNSAQRHSAASSLPRGICGGENDTGIDIFTSYTKSPSYVILDRSRPYLEFFPHVRE